MTIKQLPLYSEALYQHLDEVGDLADHPYYFNGYFEKLRGGESDRQLAFVKRPGLGSALDLSGGNFINGHKIQGVGNSPDGIGAVFYTNNGIVNRTWFWAGLGVASLVNNGAAPAAAGTWPLNSPVIFTSLDGISYGSGNKWAVCDPAGPKGAVVSGVDGVWTEITDADYTTAFGNGGTNFVALDGYLFRGAPALNRIYNSDLNAPTSWVSTSFLSVLDTPGRLLWLGKIRNYLIAFKDKSIEFYEDVGNPTPGSPLEARKQLNKKIGLLNRNTIQEVGDGIIFAGVDEIGQSKIYKISKDDLSLKVISNRYIEQYLTGLNSHSGIIYYSVDKDISVTGANGGESSSFSLFGKTFYTIYLPNINTLDLNNYYHVYDNDLGIWTNWASDIGMTQGFTTSTGTNKITLFVDNISSDANNPPRLMKVNPASLLYNDRLSDGTENVYTFGLVTDQFDFGNRKRKFMDSLEVLYTIDSSSTPLHNDSIAGTLTIKYRDYDYTSTSGKVITRTTKLDPGGGIRGIIRRLGQFRRRSFALTYAVNTALTIWGIEVQYNHAEADQDQMQ